ncbi:uncharacterized protein LOC131850048 [Achroia grisella]|uniref:uncharacterized protein LOC131844150 n=1 Tax=Achroia grisella TaxID=688607 RepID=UPI0027D274C8|nr:uncharacterized protein LOC131844150 [Achroia grisella]XP_059056187.1 uncharacterized protein LOC131850048 [Achroia grisella]
MAEIDLQMLFKFISEFDGSREKLNPFLNNCRNAIELASPHQIDILFKYIISKLEGRAQIACSIKEFTDWEQLEEFLKNQFGEKNYYIHLLCDLQACKQNYNEVVNQFALRVETCLAKLLTKINISIPTKKKLELSGRVAAMQDLALHTFITGLNPKLSTIVRCRDPDTLNSAINFAVAEEKILQTYKPQPSSSHTGQYERPRQNSNVRYDGNRQTSSKSSNVNFTPGNPIICRYCKFLGHSLENCKRREYDNKYRNNFTANQPTTYTQNLVQRVNYVEDIQSEAEPNCLEGSNLNE